MEPDTDEDVEPAGAEPNGSALLLLSLIGLLVIVGFLYPPATS